MKKITLLCILLLLFINQAFADDCSLASEKLEGKWTYLQSGVEHILEFNKGDNFVILDGAQKDFFSCYYFKSINQLNLFFKEGFDHFEFQFLKEQESAIDSNIKVKINWKEFDLVPYQSASNKPLSENSLAIQNGFDWKPEVGLDGQIFPSLVISTATWSDNDKRKKSYLSTIKNAEYIGDLNGLIKVVINNVEPEAKIKLEIDLGNIARPSVFESVLDKANTIYVVKPRIDFDYQTLLAIKQPTPLNAKIALYVNGEKVGEKIQTVTVRSINDAPIYAQIGSKYEEGNDYSYVFAAYVNENNQLIDLLLREAIDTGVVNSFSGYQGGDQEVYKQVFSIWNILQRRGMKYSSITTPTGHSDKVFSQYVRFFDDTIATSQANCIDGTVLFASILRRVGINPKIVIIPGHAFLGFDLDEKGRTIAFLETTLMGSEDLQKYSDGGAGIAGDVARLLGKTKNQVSQKSFLVALEEGDKKANLNRQRFLSNASGYKIIDIAAARKMGIASINH